MLNFLKGASNKDSDAEQEFSEKLEYGEKMAWSETISIKEMYAIRVERQKSVLLEKVSSLSKMKYQLTNYSKSETG